MSAERFRGYTPKEVADMTLLYGESELRRMAAAGLVPHHRGARNRIVFFADDIEALLRMTKQEPTPKPESVPEDQNPFRGTTRSNALHSVKPSV